jgi:hypothetical protein
VVHQAELIVGVGVPGPVDLKRPLDFPGLAFRRPAQMQRKSALYRSIASKGEAVCQDDSAELSPPPGTTGAVIPWVFHRAGMQIKSFRRAWVTACRKAGIPERVPHDFRRTAVRNLERAGVPQSTAMKMVGHRTESIYRRYAIVDEAMLKEGAAKLQILHDTQQAPVSNVVRLADAKRLGSSSGRVARTKRDKIGPATRVKLSKSGGKNMVGRDGIEPPTPGFSVLFPGSCKCA